MKIFTLFMTILLARQVFAEKTNILITGSSTIAPLATELASDFELKNPNYKIDVQSGGSSKGINDVRQNLAEIGMVSRKLTPEEKDLYPVLVAYDGLSIILHTKNKITQLTNEQILSIYKGQIKNWKELGGKDAPITVIHKAEGRSTLELFLDFFKLKNSEVHASAIVGENEQAIKMIAQNQNAIGYVSIGSAEFNQQKGAHIKLLPLNHIPANTENIKNKSFPLMRELNFVVLQKNKNLKFLNQFIDYLKTVDAKKIIEKEYFVPANSF